MNGLIERTALAVSTESIVAGAFLNVVLSSCACSHPPQQWMQAAEPFLDRPADKDILESPGCVETASISAANFVWNR